MATTSKRTRLSDWERKEIRRLADAGFSMIYLARKFDTSERTIYRARTGR